MWINRPRPPAGLKKQPWHTGASHEGRSRLYRTHRRQTLGVKAGEGWIPFGEVLRKTLCFWVVLVHDGRQPVGRVSFSWFTIEMKLQNPWRPPKSASSCYLLVPCLRKLSPVATELFFLPVGTAPFVVSGFLENTVGAILWLAKFPYLKKMKIQGTC